MPKVLADARADLSDATLAEIRLALAGDIAANAAFDGWSDEALVSAAEMHGVNPAVARLAFPDGAMDMIAGFASSIDGAMEQGFGGQKLDNLPIREKIKRLIWFRLDSFSGKEEALRRALTVQAMPQNLTTALRLGWGSADKMWRLAGDKATDYNHYTKRMTLGSIYAATLAVYAEDGSEDKAETRAFLDRRIEGVMKFEKAKAQILRKREGFELTRFIGRLRYQQR